MVQRVCCLTGRPMLLLGGNREGEAEAGCRVGSASKKSKNMLSRDLFKSSWTLSDLAESLVMKAMRLQQLGRRIEMCLASFLSMMAR